MKGYANTDHLFLRLPNGVLGTYNAWDAHNTAALVGPLTEELRSNHQLDYFTTVTSPLVEAVLAMQRRGVRVNMISLQTLRTNVLRELHEVDRALFKAHGKRINLGSAHQVGRWLYDQLGLKPPKRSKKGHRSVDQEALTRCLRDLRKKDEPHRQVLYDLLHRSRLDTVRERYLDFHVDSDSRVRPIVKMASTKTTRFAYADPALQQYPPECRFVFESQYGHMLLSADYSQLEARILFHYAQDHRALELLRTGQDIHAANAKDLFQLSDQQWEDLGPTKKGYRNYAKAFLYRKLYGGTAASGDKKLMCPCPRCAHKNPDLVKMTPAEARQAEARWDAKHPELNRWYGKLFDFIRSHNYFEPMLGGRRYVFSPWNRDLEREMRNAPMQTGAAQLMQRSQVRLHQLGAPIILQLHDQFVLEVPLGDVDLWADRVRTAMEEPVDRGPLAGVVFPVDVVVGQNWGDYSPSNPRGLKAWQRTPAASGLPSTSC